MFTQNVLDRIMQICHIEVNDEEDMEDLMGDDLCDDEDVFEGDSKKCKEKWEHMRINWGYHVAKLIHEDKFEKEYKINFEAWDRLRSWLVPSLQRNESKSRSLSPITVDIIMGCGMRYLTGSMKSAIRHIFGMSLSSAHRCCTGFILAVLSCKHLQISFPSDISGWDKLRRGFCDKSKDGIMNGCVGAIDGMLQKTIAPKKNEVSNVRSYYSGHYEHYGLNCQGACDVNLRFIYFGVIGPGSMNDNIAFSVAGNLSETIKNLPQGMYFVGDAAYTVSDTLLIPFTGADRDVEQNDIFNFYLSQLRIRIEMAFGLLVNRFRILKRPLEMSLEMNSKTIMACAMLHNYIIDGNDVCINDRRSFHDSTSSLLGHQHMDDNQWRDEDADFSYLPTMIEEGYEEMDGVSMTRKAIVDFLQENGYKRPVHNLLRNGRYVEDNNNGENEDNNNIDDNYYI